MTKDYKKSEIIKAESDLQDFCDRFSVVLTYTNYKKVWTCRATKNNVQVFLATGQSLIGCMIDAQYKSALKRQSLGV